MVYIKKKKLSKKEKGKGQFEVDKRGEDMKKRENHCGYGDRDWSDVATSHGMLIAIRS